MEVPKKNFRIFGFQKKRKIPVACYLTSHFTFDIDIQTLQSPPHQRISASHIDCLGGGRDSASEMERTSPEDCHFNCGNGRSGGGGVRGVRGGGVSGGFLGGISGGWP